MPRALFAQAETTAASLFYQMQGASVETFQRPLLDHNTMDAKLT